MIFFVLFFVWVLLCKFLLLFGWTIRFQQFNVLSRRFAFQRNFDFFLRLRGGMNYSRIICPSYGTLFWLHWHREREKENRWSEKPQELKSRSQEQRTTRKLCDKVSWCEISIASNHQQHTHTHIDMSYKWSNARFVVCVCFFLILFNSLARHIHSLNDQVLYFQLY